jgi:mRNA interferase RelE/StbE
VLGPAGRRSRHKMPPSLGLNSGFTHNNGLIFEQFHHAFQALELTNDLSIFDIKALKGGAGDERFYFRLRKGKYRAIFYVENENYYVISIAKRDEVYKKWQ